MVTEAAPLPEELAQALEAFLAEFPAAVLAEEGKALFAMDRAKYSVKTDRGKCVLQVWNADRNIVRRIVGLRQRKGTLFLSASRFGQAKPVPLELSAETRRRVASEEQAKRERYVAMLSRVLEREFPGWKLEDIRTRADLTRSFGPAYVRAEMRRGTSVMALVAISENETRDAVEDVLTTGILWLDSLRDSAGEKRLIGGLRVIVPAGRSRLTAARIGWLDHDAAKWELFELDEFSEELTAIPASDGGNLQTRLMQAPDETSTVARFATEVEQVRALVPECEVGVVTAGEVAFRLHGLVFARARVRTDGGYISHAKEVVFGAGPNETVLDADTGELFRSLLARLREHRTPEGSANNPLYRMHPEAWLVSQLKTAPEVLDESLRGSKVYAQVAAFEAEDRGMIDLLARTRDGQLAIVEVKAQEDMQLPLQGLDYWIRVRHHHLRAEPSEFVTRGYFRGQNLARVEPLLVLAGPALRVHPKNETVLKYFSPRVPWLLAGIDERWRATLRGTWRKRSNQAG